MVMIDVLIPALDRLMDFELDEEKKVGELLTDILFLIEEKEGLPFENRQKLQLYAIRGEGVLDKEASMAQQNVRSGDCLLLI